MGRSLLDRAAGFLLAQRRRKRWQKAVSAMAAVVVFCTTYALILPAITLSNDPICGLEEHTHTEECYAAELRYPQSTMDCTLNSGGAPVIHTHDGNCYSEDGTLICELPELEAHRHTGRCYREVRTLICTEEEDLGHAHSDACYARHRGELICAEEEDEGHTHDDRCYDVDRELTCDDDSEDHEHDDGCYTETEELTCTEEERPGHTHSDRCYEWTEELICTEEERPAGHIHTDDCYEITEVLDCGREEVIPHVHDESCYDDGGALKCGLEEVLEHRHTAECIVPPEGDPWEVQVLVCGLEEHTHTEDCYPRGEEDPLPGGGGTSGEGTEVPEEEVPAEEVPEEELPEEPEYLCGLEEHTHTEECYDPEGDLTCGLEEHTHHEECLAAEEEIDEDVQAVIGLIDALPSSEEAEAALTAYEEVEDWESYEGYFLSVERQARYAYERYAALTEDQQAQVTNADKLMELEWLWSAATLDLPKNAVEVTKQSELKTALTDGAYIALSADFSVSEELEIPKNAAVTLDLNGHTLTATGSGALFTVPAGASLTVVDSMQNAETVETASGDLAGHTASFSNNQLTYYVTISDITDPATGATQETMEKHTVTAAGSIVGGSQPVFRVTGGTLTIRSGMVRGGTGRAIRQTDGTTNFEGGYLCGFAQSSSSTDNTAFGGAVKISGGTLNLSGGVLAGNSAPNGGGIYATGSAQIAITGGVISGNTANRTTSGWNDHSESGAYRCGGGGIYADGNAGVTMSGGYITNNVATHDGYFDGGGGVCLSGESSMALTGGYVTGNKASGGGGIRTDFGKKATFEMEGGFVSANVAVKAEGGGVTIDNSGVGTVTGGYVTNNKILPPVGHWGGGGLFCATNSTLNLKNALITQNTAGGFGAGVAGCPTGNLYLYVNEGCAIFENKDIVDSDSPHYTTEGQKQVDRDICTEVFLENGHADYFCALNSTVTGTMLGNNAANWQGSADYQPVIADAEDLLSAEKVMGLQSHPTKEGKAAAEKAAKVYINGNYAYTHGGGIMCNGNLVIGVPVDIEVPARVELQATKKLVDQSGNSVPMEDDNGFSFRVTMTEENGTVIANGTCDSSGKISFDHQLTFKEAGTFVYYVYEKADGDDPLMTYDSTRYRLTMTVARDNGVAWYGDTIKYTYSVTSVKVEKSTDGETWTTVSNSNTSQSGVITLPLTDGTTFTNHVTEVTKMTVEKKWEGGIGADSVTVILKKDGEEFDRQTLSAGNGWTYTWKDLEKGHSYTVEEVPVDGYTASYEVTSGTGNSGSVSLGQGSWWVPATELTDGQQYLIVSPDGTKALCVASDNNEKNWFDTQDVAAVVQQQTPITVNGQIYSTWYQTSDIPERSIYVAENLIRGSDRGIVLKQPDIEKAPYLRVEPNNEKYFKGASSTTYASFMVFDGIYLRSHEMQSWTPNNLYTVSFENGKFNATTNQSPSNAVKLYTLVSSAGSGSSTVVITNTRDETGDYELPETGGTGTTLYTMGGLCLMAGALLLYSLQIRRKGGRDGPC